MKNLYVFYHFILFKFINVEYDKLPIVYGRLIKNGSGKLVFGANCKIVSNLMINPVGLTSKCMFYIAPKAIIALGNNVGISNSLLYSTSSITIEDDVMIGGGCQILDNDFHSLKYSDRILHGDSNVKTAPVLIKKGAFIGTSSIILKGVTIGERSIIAAGSVVSNSVPSDEIWGGNPAKFIKIIVN